MTAALFDQDNLGSWEPPAEYLDPFYDWVEEASSEYRAVNPYFEIEDINPKENKVVIYYEGEHSKSGKPSSGGIIASLSGKVLDVSGN